MCETWSRYIKISIELFVGTGVHLPWEKVLQRQNFPDLTMGPLSPTLPLICHVVHGGQAMREGEGEY